METTRLRQAVVATGDLEGIVRIWRDELGLGAGFADPGVEPRTFTVAGTTFGIVGTKA